MASTVAVGGDTYRAAMERQEAQLARISATYREHGLVPSWERVWREGVDITHQSPSTWGWPYSDYASGKRGEAIREQYLARHAEALAEQAALL